MITFPPIPCHLCHRHDVDALFFPGALELLQFLKGRGVRLCAVTNGNCDIDQIAAFNGTYCCCYCCF